VAKKSKVCDLLVDTVLPDLQDIWYRSKKSGRETGITMCYAPKSRRVRVTNLCQGDECSIDIPAPDCLSREVRASVHTHPNMGLAQQSIDDIKVGLHDNLRFMCSIANDTGAMLCIEGHDKVPSHVGARTTLRELNQGYDQLYDDLEYLEEKEGDTGVDRSYEEQAYLVLHQFLDRHPELSSCRVRVPERRRRR